MVVFDYPYPFVADDDWHSYSRICAGIHKPVVLDVPDSPKWTPLYELPLLKDRTEIRPTKERGRKAADDYGSYPLAVFLVGLAALDDPPGIMDHVVKVVGKVCFDVDNGENVCHAECEDGLNQGSKGDFI